MSYITVQQLATRFGIAELAEIASDDPAVTAELLQLTIDGGDRSAYSQAAQDAADAALAKINQAITDGAGEINGYLQAAGYTLPLTSTSSVLELYNGDIARYRLYDDAASEEIRNRYKDAVGFLKSVSAGTVNLGADTLPQKSGGVAEHRSEERVFSRDTLCDF